MSFPASTVITIVWSFHNRDCAMDHVLNIADSYIFTPYVYPASWPEDGALRQIISLWVVTNLGAVLIYLGFGALSFYYVFDHKLMKHPQFIKNQLRKEIQLSVVSIFWMSFPTVAIFFLEIKGNGKLYDNISESSLALTQAAPYIQDPYASCQPCLPPSGRLPAELTLSRLPIHLSPAQGGLPLTLCLCQHLDHFHTRRRLPPPRPPDMSDQRRCAPRRPSSLLQLQLRTVLHALGSSGGLLPAPVGPVREGAT
ncbi:uncharacterized protein LOC142938720 isoform X3 [Anarhichas minor]|uniref:uncharacterized protein LOC142938720 isoform X3 n=1 Tax=Anarhichas minor TaxID=65739 RepID=UPI003F73FD9E